MWNQIGSKLHFLLDQQEEHAWVRPTACGRHKVPSHRVRIFEQEPGVTYASDLLPRCGLCERTHAAREAEDLIVVEGKPRVFHLRRAWEDAAMCGEVSVRHCGKPLVTWGRPTPPGPPQPTFCTGCQGESGMWSRGAQWTARI